MATRLTVAVERLAVLAAVTLPITAVASVYGMNVIVHQDTQSRSWWPSPLMVAVAACSCTGTNVRAGGAVEDLPPTFRPFGATLLGAT